MQRVIEAIMFRTQTLAAIATLALVARQLRHGSDELRVAHSGRRNRSFDAASLAYHRHTVTVVRGDVVASL